MSDFQIIDEVPEGFRALRLGGGMIKHNGPLMGCLEDGGMIMGMLVDERHLNPAGICHGGMLMTLADMLLGVGAMVQTKEWEFVPTINMTCDFVKAVPGGAWISGKTKVVRRTKNMLFSSCLITHGDEVVMRASGIMKRTGNFREADPERIFEPHGG